MFQMQDPTKDPILQAVQFSVASNLMPKDPAVEAFKANAVNSQLLEQLAKYKALKKECKKEWKEESADILKKVNNDMDHPTYTAALKDHEEEMDGWKSAIKRIQDKLV